jgi:hypothetical protein
MGNFMNVTLLLVMGHRCIFTTTWKQAANKTSSKQDVDLSLIQIHDFSQPVIYSAFRKYSETLDLFQSELKMD